MLLPHRESRTWRAPVSTEAFFGIPRLCKGYASATIAKGCLTLNALHVTCRRAATDGWTRVGDAAKTG